VDVLRAKPTHTFSSTFVLTQEPDARDGNWGGYRDMK